MALHSTRPWRALALVNALGCPLVAFAAGAPPLLSADRFVVQEKVSFEWVYTVGPEGFGPGDEVRLHDPQFHGMRWSKWGDLSPFREKCTENTSAQRASWGLVGAQAWRGGSVLGELPLGVERSNCSYQEGPGEWTCTADIHRPSWTSAWLEGEEGLVEGDQIVLTYGDTAGCEAACEAAGEADCSYCELCGLEMSDRTFKEIPLLSEECLGGEACAELDPVSLEITAEPVVRYVNAVVPSFAVAGEPFVLKVALLDRWGNAVASSGETLTVDLGGASGSVDESTWTSAPADGGWHDFELTLEDSGVHRISVSSSSGRTGTSNPVEVGVALPAMNLFWGDVHVHHGQSLVDSDGMVEDVNHAYARDVVGMDIVAESMKATGIEIDSDLLWEELQRGCAEYTVEGSYVVLLAFEWIGQIAADTYGTETEGHHNVYYDVCEAPIGTHSLDIIDSVSGDKGLWPWVREQQALYGMDAISIPHATRFTGHNFTVDDPDLQRLVEVYSEWGDDASITAETDGSVQDMLRSGIRVGWMAASDNHDGWMGNPYSEKNAPSGLGAWWAPSLTRAEVFGAMRARRTFGTTGHRPILRFLLEDTDGAASVEVMPGSEVIARAPRFRWRVNGTAPISQITLYSTVMTEGGATTEVAVETPGSLDPETGRASPDWDGETPTAFWLEVRQSDGERAWSSPFWLTGDCDRRDEGALDPLGLCEGGTGSGDDAGTDDTGSGSSTGSLPDSADPDGAADTGTAMDEGGLRCGCRGPQGNAAAAGAGLFVLLLAGLRRRETER